MALTTPGTLRDFSAVAAAAADDAVLAQTLAGVEAALLRLIAPNVIEQQTVTMTLDAPCNSRTLVLPVRPVQSVTSLYYRSDANGDATLFTPDYLLTAAGSGDDADYRLVPDQPDGTSRRGFVERVGRPYWGQYQTRTQPYQLSSTFVPEPGSVRATWVAGYSSVPPDVELAVLLASVLVLQRRKSGMPVTNESWNGYSAGYASPFAVAALLSPDVQGYIRKYMPARIA